MLRLFLSSAIQAKWGKWWSSGKSLKQRRHHPSLFQALKGVIGKQCKLNINHICCLFHFFLEKYAVLHHLVLVGFLLLKNCWILTTPTLFLISKSMLTYITQALSVFDFEKYVDLQHLVVVCFLFWKVCWLTSPSRCLFLILKSMLTYITQSLYVFWF